mgnify:CR=1 FL=1
MSNPLRILEDQAKKNKRADEPEAILGDEAIISDNADWIYGKTYTGNAYRKERDQIVRAQSRLNIGSLSIKFSKKRPGPIRRAFIKWLLGWTWDELTQEKEEDKDSICRPLIGSEKVDPLSTPGYYYQRNSGSITFGDKGRGRNMDMDMLNAIPTTITAVPSLRTNDLISGSPR